MAFAIQRVLPTSPIYRGPNPTHIEVQICAHKGSKALPTSQRTLAFALDQNSGTQQLDTLAIRTSSLSNWTLWLSAQDFMVVTPQNRATGHSSYPHKSSQATGHSSYPHKSPQLLTQGICETGRWHASSFPLHPKGRDFNQFASGLDLKRCQ